MYSRLFVRINFTRIYFIDFFYFKFLGETDMARRIFLNQLLDLHTLRLEMMIEIVNKQSRRVTLNVFCLLQIAAASAFIAICTRPASHEPTIRVTIAQCESEYKCSVN